MIDFYERVKLSTNFLDINTIFSCFIMCFQYNTKYDKTVLLNVRTVFSVLLLDSFNIKFSLCIKK